AETLAGRVALDREDHGARASGPGTHGAAVEPGRAVEAGQARGEVGVPVAVEIAGTGDARAALIAGEVAEALEQDAVVAPRDELHAPRARGDARGADDDVVAAVAVRVEAARDGAARARASAPQLAPVAPREDARDVALHAREVRVAVAIHVAHA